ncbi:hypothetical protein WA026_000767 [Henosepilachna vigintioctopunctata]|uniref:Uncharacterized protein n=1 Tax=Henosepilachna vigintioctopunctata TaxID=420089 RepID=A0AAW1V669_9CUCU
MMVYPEGRQVAAENCLFRSTGRDCEVENLTGRKVFRTGKRANNSFPFTCYTLPSGVVKGHADCGRQRIIYVPI